MNDRKYQMYKEKYISAKKELKFKQKGGIITLVHNFGSRGFVYNKFDQPTGITLLNDGNFAICDKGNDRIQIVSPNGEFITNFGSKGYGDGQFNKPEGITVLQDGNLAICDTKNNRIQIMSPIGEYITDFGLKGNEDGKFNEPGGITLLKDGNLAICDTLNNRIQIISPSGVFVKKINTTASPKNLTQLFDGNLAFSCNHEIQIIKLSGEVVKKFGSYGSTLQALGSAEIKFRYPIGIIQLTDGNLAICDSLNNKIQIISINGIHIEEFGLLPGSNQNLSAPSSLIQLDNGNIAVCDTNNSNIKIYMKPAKIYIKADIANSTF